MNTQHLYTIVRNWHDTTKPIRGRKVDIRPANKRRRDWELIYLDPATEDVCFKLYQSTVMRFHKDNTFSLAAEGWATTTTGAFMTGVFRELSAYTHTQVMASRCDNALWLWSRGPDRWAKIPIPSKDMCKYVWKPSANAYVNAAPVTTVRRVTRIDKESSKAAREKIKEFTKYMRATFKVMGDTVFEDQTVMDHIDVPMASYFRNRVGSTSSVVLERIKDHMESNDPEKWLRLLTSAGAHYYHIARSTSDNSWYNQKMNGESCKTMASRIEKVIKDVYELTIEVEKETVWAP